MTRGGFDRSGGRLRSARIIVIEALDIPARLLAMLGLHRINNFGRRIVEYLTADQLSVIVDDFRLSGRVCHRGYLYRIRRKRCEPYMADIFAKLLKPGMVVVDVGAFIGFYSIKAALEVGPKGAVFSLEPDPVNFSALQANVEANGTDRWTLVMQAAAGNLEGEIPLFVDRWDPTQSGVGGFRPGTSKIIVPVVRLDRILEAVDHVDMIKIDCEGFEMAVLTGLEGTISRMQGRPMTIFVECFPAALRALGGSPEEMLQWLKRHGFFVGSIDEQTMSIAAVGTDADYYANWFCTTSEADWRAFAHAGEASADHLTPD